MRNFPLRITTDEHKMAARINLQKVFKNVLALFRSHLFIIIIFYLLHYVKNVSY